MNIYIHVEISSRELDSKLLLAVIAASRGHTVIVSCLNAIINGAARGVLSPGIFHTKSLTPTVSKIARHQSLVDRGFMITSIDEESGLYDDGYEQFCRTRYSDETLKQAAAVFGWGADDTNTLRQFYPDYAEKIHKTGSPRVDLWGTSFKDYWVLPDELPRRPYLLISSNLGFGNGWRPFYETIHMEREAGYYQRDKAMFRKAFEILADDARMTWGFIDAIRQLSTIDKGYDIVLRPHPAESVKAWKVFLKDIPNVYVTRQGPISAWVNNAFAVMHNGCTTAIEANISGAPIISYLPFKRTNEWRLANDLGHRAETVAELLQQVDYLYENRNVMRKSHKAVAPAKSLTERIYLDEKELAAERIVKVWESFVDENLNQPVKWRLFRWQLLASKALASLAAILRLLFPLQFGKTKGNYKFPPMDETEIRGSIQRLQDILGLDTELQCKLLADRTLLIQPKE